MVDVVELAFQFVADSDDGCRDSDEKEGVDTKPTENRDTQT